MKARKRRKSRAPADRLTLSTSMKGRDSKRYFKIWAVLFLALLAFDLLYVYALPRLFWDVDIDGVPLYYHIPRFYHWWIFRPITLSLNFLGMLIMHYTRWKYDYAGFSGDALAVLLSTPWLAILSGVATLGFKPFRCMIFNRGYLRRSRRTPKHKGRASS